MRRLVMAVLILAGTTARADEPAPWAVGVTAEQKTTAQEHLDKGNAKFVERDYRAALVEYTAAIQAWDHPAIRFNKIRCEAQLDQWLEARDDLDRALQYGLAPFDDAIHTEVLEVQKLVESKTSEVEASCDQAGVEVTLDAQPFITCPGTNKKRVLPGPHELVGKGHQLITSSVPLTVYGGKPERTSITLEPLAKAAHIEHRYRTWIPWTVGGSGLALAGLGALLHLKATSDNDAYKDLVNKSCVPTCPTDPDPALARTASIENGVAIGMIIAGALTVATGTTMLYLNRGQTVYTDVEPTRGGATLSVSGRF